MSHRDSNGRFLPGNPYRFRRNDERTIRAAKRGFQQMVKKTFHGRKGAAMEWLGLCKLRDAGMLDSSWFDTSG